MTIEESHGETRDYVRAANAFSDLQSWKQDRREIAARIANDRQLVISTIETVLMGWDRDGLLADAAVTTWNSLDVPGQRTVEVKTGLAAASWFAACADDTMGDALSAIAREALDVARERF